MAASRPFKMILLGRQGSGKSTLMKRLTREDFRFREDEPTTIGADYAVVDIPADGEYGPTGARIWDLTGAERYASFWRVYSDNVSACVLVFDLAAPDVGEQIRQLKEMIRNADPAPQPEYHLVFTKQGLAQSNNVDCDRIVHQVTTELESSNLNFRGIHRVECNPLHEHGIPPLNARGLLQSLRPVSLTNANLMRAIATDSESKEDSLTMTYNDFNGIVGSYQSSSLLGCIFGGLRSKPIKELFKHIDEEKGREKTATVSVKQFSDWLEKSGDTARYKLFNKIINRPSDAPKEFTTDTDRVIVEAASKFLTKRGT
jgi:small GTP-binding protein